MVGTTCFFQRGLLAACAFALALLAGPNADAQQGPVALQLKPMALTAISPNGYRGRTTVTVYLEVDDDDAFRYVCRHLPRVVDAIVVAFDQQPMTIDALVAKLESRQDELGGLIEDALGVGVFSRLHVVAGSRRRGEGTKTVAIAGGSPECQAIQYIPWTSESPPDAATQVNTIEGERAAARAAIEAERDAKGEEPQRSFAEIILEVPDWALWVSALVGFAGIGLMIAGYVGYKIGKKRRRDRRQRERRMRNPDRRGAEDRRTEEKKDVSYEPERRVRNRRGGLPNRRTGPNRRRAPRRDDD